MTPKAPVTVRAALGARARRWPRGAARRAAISLTALLLACSDPARSSSATPPAPSATPPPSEVLTATLVQTVPVEAEGLARPGIPHTHEVWREMIARAEHSVDVGAFYLSSRKGSRLEPILDELAAASRRGVAVRVLVDASFADKYPDDIARIEATAEVRRLDLGAETGGVQHAKFLVVDGRELYLGSANFDWRALEHIHEMGVRVQAPELARSLAELFELDWGGSYEGRSLGPWGGVVIDDERWTLRASPRDLVPVKDGWDLPELIRVIDGAKRAIDIQLLSYDAAHRSGEPWTELHAALLRAGQRGVRVRLLLSHWQKSSPMDALRELERSPGVDVALVEIPQHSGGFIPFARVTHAKYMVVDGKVSWIGTSNWKADYFYASRNVGVFVEGESTAGELSGVFEAVFQSPYAAILDPDAEYTPPRVAE